VSEGYGDRETIGAHPGIKTIIVSAAISVFQYLEMVICAEKRVAFHLFCPSLTAEAMENMKYQIVSMTTGRWLE